MDTNSVGSSTGSRSNLHCQRHFDELSNLRKKLEMERRIEILKSEISDLNDDLVAQENMIREKNKTIKVLKERNEELKMLGEIQRILRHKATNSLRGRVSMYDQKMVEKQEIIMRHLKKAKIGGGIVGGAAGGVAGGAGGIAGGAVIGATVGLIFGALGGPLSFITIPAGVTVGTFAAGFGVGLVGTAAGAAGGAKGGISIAENIAFKNAWKEILRKFGEIEEEAFIEIEEEGELDEVEESVEMEEEVELERELSGCFTLGDSGEDEFTDVEDDSIEIVGMTDEDRIEEAFTSKVNKRQ